MQAVLAHIPLFRTLPAPALKKLGDSAELRRFRKGERLFEEGQPAESVWLVQRKGWITSSRGKMTVVLPRKLRAWLNTHPPDSPSPVAGFRNTSHPDLRHRRLLTRCSRICLADAEGIETRQRPRAD